MKVTFTKIIAAACLALLCCSVPALAQDVRYNYAPSTDFAKYKTYKWAPIEGGTHPNQIVEDQIKQAVDSQLASKGLAKTDDEKADLYVTYQVAVDQEKQWNAYGMGGGVRWGGMGGMGTATSSTINIGTLVVDIYDAPEKKQIWHGTATKTLNPSKNQEKNMQNLQKAVAKLMKNYPPPAKS